MYVDFVSLLVEREPVMLEIEGAVVAKPWVE